MSKRSPQNNEKMLERLQRDSFGYFLNEVNRDNGLIADKTEKGWPASIAAVGLALTAYLVGVERGFMSRQDAVGRTLTTLRFFYNSPQGTQKDTTGYKGFYYHFLDMDTGRRVWNCELSTIDTTLLLAGILAAALYFNGEGGDEGDIRKLAEELYRRVDWQWALGEGSDPRVTLGWKPESGFLNYRWEGYDEALILYLLGLGSPTYPLPDESYPAWASTYKWKKIYGYEYAYAGPLFIHQLSHIWIDFKGIQDSPMRGKGIDYFENSRRASYAQQQYAKRNPQAFEGYSEHSWGVTASDGPGPATKRIDGIERQFYDYIARGIPYGPDDGTLAPWAVVTSLPFAPEIVLPAIRHFDSLQLRVDNQYGYKATFNPTFQNSVGAERGWVSPYHYGINQGPIVLMIENYRTGLVWQLMRRSPQLVRGLRRAGFGGGWLESIDNGNPASK
jgi:hypothetical protein